MTELLAVIPCPTETIAGTPPTRRSGAHGVELSRIEEAFPTFFRGTPPNAGERLAEFFAAHIRNKNTRAAYLQAVIQFIEWAERNGLTLREMTPFRVAAYVETLAIRPDKEILHSRRSSRGRVFAVASRRTMLAPPSVKQHLAAIRMLFDWLVIGQVSP